MKKLNFLIKKINFVEPDYLRFCGKSRDQTFNENIEFCDFQKVKPPFSTPKRQNWVFSLSPFLTIYPVMVNPTSSPRSLNLKKKVRFPSSQRSLHHIIFSASSCCPGHSVFSESVWGTNGAVGSPAFHQFSDGIVLQMISCDFTNYPVLIVLNVLFK